MIYDHWLVTKGKDRHSVGKHGLVPIVLVPKIVGLRELTRLVREEIDKRICVFLDDTVSSIEVLRASTRPYVLDLVTNLWLRDVRVTRQIDLTSQEDMIGWTLRGMRQKVPTWQGPADGVIHPAYPISVWDHHFEPSPFKIIDD